MTSEWCEVVLSNKCMEISKYHLTRTRKLRGWQNNMAVNASNHSNASSPPYFREAFEIHLQVFFLIIILITTVVGNILVLIIIWLDHRLHSPGFYFLANLSIADLVLGFVYNPFYISSTLHQKWLFSQTWCKLHAVTISTSFNASLVTLSFVSLDRFMAITKPLR